MGVAAVEVSGLRGSQGGRRGRSRESGDGGAACGARQPVLRFKLRKESADLGRQLLGGAGGLGDGAAVRPLPLPVEA